MTMANPTRPYSEMDQPCFCGSREQQIYRCKCCSIGCCIECKKECTHKQSSWPVAPDSDISSSRTVCGNCWSPSSEWCHQCDQVDILIGSPLEQCCQSSDDLKAALVRLHRPLADLENNNHLQLILQLFVACGLENLLERLYQDCYNITQEQATAVQDRKINLKSHSHPEINSGYQKFANRRKKVRSTSSPQPSQITSEKDRIMKQILLEPSYQVIRLFLNQQLAAVLAAAVVDAQKQEIFNRLLKVSCSYYNQKHKTALHVFAEENHETLLRFILSSTRQNPDKLIYVLSVRDNNGETVLYLAARKRHDTIIKLLLDSVSDCPNICIKELMLASIFRSVDDENDLVIKSLFNEYMNNDYAVKRISNDIKQMWGMINPFLSATINGDIHQIKEILHNFCEGSHDNLVHYLIHVLNKEKRMPLHLAAIHGKLDVAYYLIKKGASVNATDKNSDGKDNFTALHLAAQNGHKDVVKCLLKHNAEINLTACDGSTALSLAAEENRWDVVKNLIEKGANNVTGKKGPTPIFHISKACRWDLAKSMIQRGCTIDSLNPDQKLSLLNHVSRSNIKASLDTNKIHLALYNTINLNNAELFQILMSELQKVSCNSPCTIQMRNDVLSQVYEELKLSNVPLSLEMKILIQDSLLDQNFFMEKNDRNIQEVKTNIHNVKERLGLVNELIDQLVHKYLGEARDTVDDMFIMTARFIAQNLHILKRQLRSTYNVLPWEEIEFCLVNFISVYVKYQDFNFVYKLIINKNGLLKHLKVFNSRLIEVSDKLTDKDVNSAFPKYADKKLSARNAFVKSVLDGELLFKKLYDNYEIIKTVYSLKRMESYIKIAVSIDLDKRDGILIIQRTLQVIGECLKNTVESPNVSEEVHKLLHHFAPRNLREMVTSLRNSLSHSYALANRLKLEQFNDHGFLSQVQNDLKKLEIEIRDILNKKMMDAIKQFLNEIINSKNTTEVKALGKNLKGAQLGELKLENISTNELLKAGILVDKFNTIMKDKSKKEIRWFKEIIKNIDSEKARLAEFEINFVKEFSRLNQLIKQIDHTNFEIIRTSAKKYVVNIESEIQPGKMKDILKLLTKITASFIGREKENTSKEIVETAYKIIETLEFELKKVKGIKEFKEILDTYQSSDLIHIQELEKVFSEIEYKLDKKNRKLFRDTLKSKQNVCENKLKLRLLFTDLQNESISKDKLSVNLHYEQLIELIGIKKAKKELLNQYFSQAKWNECIETIDNIRDGYETLLNSIKKSSNCQNAQNLYKLVNGYIKSTFKKDFQEMVNKIIDNISKDISSQLQGYFRSRLEKLKGIICIEKNKSVLASTYKENIEVQASVEMLVLDVLELLENEKHLGDNRLFLDMFSPILSGKVLRNYLAHGDALTDILLVDPHIAIICNAYKLVSINIEENTLIGQQMQDSPSGLNDHFKNSRTIISIHDKMFLAAQQGNLHNIKKYLAKGANVLARNFCGWTGVHFSAVGNSEECMNFFMRNNLSINMEDSNGKTPFHIATASGCTNIIQNFVQDNLNISYKSITLNINVQFQSTNGQDQNMFKQFAHVENKIKTTLLHLAARKGQTEIAKLLLNKGANVNAFDENKWTPLHRAAEAGHTYVTLLLLNNGAVSNVLDDNKWTPLHWAVQNNHLEIAEILIEKGANVNVLEKDNGTPLHLACQGGYKDVVKMLLERGATVNSVTQQHQTPLHMASWNGNHEVLGLLLNRGAHVDVHDQNKYTPLHLAAKAGHLAALEVLLENGANVDEDLMEVSITPLHLAACLGHVSVVKALLRKGCNVYAQTPDNLAAIHMAVIKGHLPVVDLLLENGVPVDTRYENSETLLHFAAKMGHREVLNVLLERGSTVGAEDEDGLTPLHLAAQSGHLYEVERLVLNGANINATNKVKSTPLHCAAQKGQYDIVKFLCENGAIVNATSSPFSMTPLHLATTEGHLDVIHLLIKMGGNVDALTSISSDTFLFQESETNTKITSKANSLTEIASAILKCLPAFNSYINKDYGVDSINVLAKDNLIPQQLKTGVTTFHDSMKYDANMTALHMSALKGYYNIVQLLIKEGANIHALTNNQLSPIEFAAQIGHEDIVILLLQKGAKINNQKKKNGLLHIAASAGHTDVVKSLLTKGVDINAAGEDCITPLHLAVNEHECTTKLLLEWGADVNACSEPDGLMPVHFAAAQANTNIVKLLINYNAKIDSYALNNVTPLHLAILRKHQEITGILLEKGANVNKPTKEKYWSPLHLAVSFGLDNIVKILLSSGANTDAKNTEKWTPLHVAAKLGQTSIVKLLLEEGADENSLGKDDATSLHLAAQEGHLLVVELLLEKNAQINLLYKNIFPPIYLAVQNGHQKVVKLLLKKGASIHLPCNKNGTLLHFAAKVGNIDIVDMILDNGANVNYLNNNEEMPLHIAVLEGHVDLAQRLLDRGAAPDGLGGNSKTPLVVAAIVGYTKVVKLLLDRGANGDALNQIDETVFHSFCHEGLTDAVKYVLERGADVDILTKNNWTSLHYAADGGHRDIAQMLLEKGACADARTKTNETPLILALLKGHQDVVQLLLKGGANINVIYKDNESIFFHAIQHNLPKVVEMLLTNGANLNVKNNERLSPLFVAVLKGRHHIVKLFFETGTPNDIRENKDSLLKWACIFGYPNVVSVLLEKGANINTQSEVIGSCLHIAAGKGFIDVVNELLENGADFLARDNHDTVLHQAVGGNNENVLGAILEEIKKKFHQNPSLQAQYTNAPDNEGDTPLMWASESGNIKAAEMLLNCGANIDATNLNGWTALHWASKNGHLELARFLLERKADVNVRDHNNDTPLDLALVNLEQELELRENSETIVALLKSVTDQD